MMATAIIRNLLPDGDERNRLIALCITKPDIAQGILNEGQDMTSEILLQILQQSTTGKFAIMLLKIMFMFILEQVQQFQKHWGKKRTKLLLCEMQLWVDL